MESNYRLAAQSFLKGRGVEVGALHNRMLVSADAQMEYIDVVSAEIASQHFQELDALTLQKPDYIADVSARGIFEITGKKYDFVVCNHVLEHVANPIQFVFNLISGLKEGGILLLSVPDKRFTFDKKRDVTKFETILAYYYLGKSEVSDDRYIDFLLAVHPEVFGTKEWFVQAFHSMKQRYEHAQVWESDGFKVDLFKIFKIQNLNPEILLESTGDQNNFEYFVVLKF